MNGPKEFDPMGWILAAIGTLGISWLGWTSRTINQHSIKIAVLETEQENITNSLNRIEGHLGTRPLNDFNTPKE
jgi:hypothetical protein